VGLLIPTALSTNCQGSPSVRPFVRTNPDRHLAPNSVRTVNAAIVFASDNMRMCQQRGGAQPSRESPTTGRLRLCSALIRDISRKWPVSFYLSVSLYASVRVSVSLPLPPSSSLSGGLCCCRVLLLLLSSPRSEVDDTVSV